MVRRNTTIAGVMMAVALGAAACGGSAVADRPLSADPDRSEETPQTNDTSVAGPRTVSASDGAALAADPPENLVVLDVRTPEEFDEGHLAGATLIDFYDADFGAQLAELDPDRPYLLYCRSGNRSGQALELMRELGFGDVANIDGGIQAWQSAGFEVVAP